MAQCTIKTQKFITVNGDLEPKANQEWKQETVKTEEVFGQIGEEYRKCI